MADTEALRAQAAQICSELGWCFASLLFMRDGCIACALQVFEDTALSLVYAATSQPTQQQQQAMQPLLDAASAATGSSVQLPRIQHAADFEKYKDLAPGEAAHEAGYGKACTCCADGMAGRRSEGSCLQYSTNVLTATTVTGIQTLYLSIRGSSHQALHSQACSTCVIVKRQYGLISWGFTLSCHRM
jgi:hypothetical protein